MIKCPNKSLPEWKELENVVPNMAYVIWDKNNGYGIDKAPNGEPSILFENLLLKYGNRELAIIEKSKIYTDIFVNRDLDISHLNVTKSDWYTKYWKNDPSKSNLAFAITLNEEPGLFFELVKDVEDNYWSIHFKTGDKNNYNKSTSKLSKEQKTRLFLAAAKLVPFGDYLSTWGDLSKGGVSGINRFGGLGFTKVGDRAVKLETESGLDDITIPIWKKTLGIGLDLNGEPIITNTDLLNIELLDIDFTQNEELKELSKLYSGLQSGLQSRLLSIMRYKKRNLSAIDDLKNLIEKLGKVEAEQGILEFIDHASQTVAESIKFLNSPVKDINSKQLVQLKRDYLGFYIPMVKQLLALLDTTDVLSNFPNIEEIKAFTGELISTVSQVDNKFNNVLKLKTRQFLKEYAEASGSTYTDEMIGWLEDPKTDISWISLYIGMASNTDNEVVRIMENMIRNTKNQVERNTFNIGKELVALLQPAQEKYGTDIMDLLQERDSDGKTTGYFVRDLNYGLMFKDQLKMYDTLGEKFKLERDLYGKWIPPTDKKELKKYNKEVNKWLGKYTDRRYTEQYYDLRDTLLPETREALDEIQKSINAITNRVTDGKVEYTHKLTDQQVKQLELLLKEKQNLSNTYYLDGSAKTGADLKIALDLKRYRDVLKSKVSYKSDLAKYEKVRAQMLKELSEQNYRRWVALNNKWDYTLKFWDDLDSIERSSSTQSDLYLDLVELRKEILKLYRKSDSLAVNMELVSDKDAAMLKLLDLAIADAYKLAEGKKEKDANKLLFSDIAEIAETEEYKKAYKEALAAGPLIFLDWYTANHYEDKRGTSHPISIHTYIRPKDAKYMEYKPTNKWSLLDESSEWVNDNFDSEGDYIQPKRLYYDNSKSWKELLSKPEVVLLYDKLLDTMRNSNNKISFLSLTDTYKLPQMTARMMLMIGRQDNILLGLKYATKDALAIKDDDKDYVEEFALRPDNTPIKNIPTRFVKMLDDPSMITSDVVGSVVEYFAMADNFDKMSDVSDDLEMILLRLSLLEIKGKKGKTPGSMNVFIKAQLLIDMNVYGKRKNRAEFTVGKTKVDATKALSNLYGYIGKINLGFNMWAIGTNYLTGLGYTDMEGILGRYYDISDLTFAKNELFRELPTIVSNIGNVHDESKLMSLMLYNQITRSNEETFNRLDNSPALRALNQHFWYNGYTAGDFVIKSLIMLSVYHSYRLATDKAGNKRFMTLLEFVNELYTSDPKSGVVAFKLLDTTLYDVFDKLDNKWAVSDKYKSLVNTKLEDKIRNKVNNLAQKVDGNLSDTDRSAIHANTFALFLVMHRNFMIVGLQDRFKGKLYNYNTGQVEEGLYRTVGRFVLSEFSSGKLFALHQLLLDYNNLLDYEKYNVQKVLLELTNMFMLSMAVTFLLLPLADGDDADKDWFILAATYIAMRTAFEFRTLYSPLELTALLNSPSAAFASITNAADMIKLIWLPNYIGEKTPFSTIDRGVYEGMPKALKSFIKMTPLKNIIEAQDPKPKRKYLENLLMF